MKKSVISILMLLWSSSLLAERPPGSEFKSYPLRTVEFHMQSRYYKADGNFTKSGNSYDDLPSGYSYENYLFDFGARSQFFSKWAVFGDLTVGAATSQDPVTTRSNSALSEATLGTDFLLSSGSISVIPEMSVTFPLAENDYAGDTVAVGEGVLSANARMILLVDFASSRMGLHGGFNYRDKGLAPLFGYGVLGEFDFDRFSLGLDLRGYTSVGYDEESDNEIRRTNYFCRANGCAKRYGAINPGLLETNVWGRYSFRSPWSIYGGLGFAITGQNTSTGYGAVFGFLYTWQRSNERPATFTPRRRVYDPNFKEEVDDGVDQRLFQHPPLPPAEKPDAQRNRDHHQLQDELDKTEMQIEMKSNKRKGR